MDKQNQNREEGGSVVIAVILELTNNTTRADDLEDKDQDGWKSDKDHKQNIGVYYATY